MVVRGLGCAFLCLSVYLSAAMEHFGPFALSSGERRHVWHHVWSCASFTARAFLCEHTDVRLGEANKSLRVVSSASSLRVFLNPDTDNCGCGKSKWPEQLSALDLQQLLSQLS